MDPECIATDIVPKISEKHGHAPVYLSISSVLSEVPWRGGNLQTLLERFLDHVMEISQPAASVRISVHERRRLSDLEQFFSLSPRYWFQVNFKTQSRSGFEEGAKRILAQFGYHCPEWIGVEGTESQLGAFHWGTQQTPALILYVRNQGTLRNCDFLVPIIESVSYLAPAL